MTFIFLFIFLLLIGAAVWGAFRYNEKKEEAKSGTPDRYGDIRQGNPGPYRFWKHVTMWVTIGSLILLTVVSSIAKVDAGHQAVVYQFGAIKGQLSEGVNFIAPWRDTVDANIQTQKEQFKGLEAFSKETQDVFVTLTLNYNVSPDAIQTLYRQVGPGYFDRLVPNRINQIVKDTTVKYSAVDIAPNREKIRKDIKDRLKAELAPYSVNVVDVNIDNISFSKAFTASIEQKQIATQDALREQARVQQAQAQAEQVVATARGNAKANDILAASLSDRLIRYQALQKFSDKVTIALVPSGTGNLLDPSTFLKQP